MSKIFNIAKIEVEDRKIISKLIDKHRLMQDADIQISMVYQWINGEKESQNITFHVLNQMKEIQDTIERILNRNIITPIPPVAIENDTSFFKYFGLKNTANFTQIREAYKKRKLRITSYVGVDTKTLITELNEKYKIAEDYFKNIQ